MNILDEQITGDQRVQLRSVRVYVRHIGYDIGHKGLQDDEIIPLLHQLRRPTFFTRDWDFYERTLCHPRYCIVYLGVERNEVAFFVRRLLRHPEFDTEAKRMGTVVRVLHSELSYWRLYEEREVRVSWPK